MRFDGVRFVTFDRTTPGIGSLRIRSLHEDAGGTLWAGTEDGQLIQYRDGRFRTFGAADGLNTEYILRIEDDAGGALWLTSLTLTIRFDGQRFEAFRPGELPRGVRPVDRSGSWRGIWWSQDAEGLHCLIAGHVRRCLPASQLPGGPVADISLDRRGTLWLHLATGGAVRVGGREERAYTVADGLPSHPIEGPIFEAVDGTLWAGDATSGFLLRMRRGVVERIATRAICVYEDREGSLWIGTTETGLRRARARVVSMLTSDHGPSSNNVYALLHGSNGTVSTGTWGGGLIRRQPDGDTIVLSTLEGLPSPYITSLLEDRSGRLLVATSAGVVIVSESHVSPLPDPEGWLKTSVWVMHEDDDGTRWFGTQRGLAWQRAGRAGRYTSADGLPHDEVTALLRSASGDLWIGTRRGLSRLRDGRLTSYTEADGFLGNQVRALAEHGGAIWAGTYDGGLYRLTENGLTQFTTAHGLHDNGVFQLIDDGQGHFWAGGNRGIARLRIAELEAVANGRSDAVHPLVLGLQDGMATLECNGGRHPNGLRMPDGTVWIPTQGGVAVVDPSRVRDATGPPPVHLEALRINGRPADLDRPIELGADEDTLAFDYTAPTFVRAADVRFRYRLAGLHEDWVEAGTRRTAAYHQLPPGRYRLEVVATSGNGQWSANPAALVVVIHAPFWRQAWFQMLAGAGVMGLAILFVLGRAERLKRERDHQRAYARQLIDAQERERRRVSNDLHDSLGQTLFMIRQHARAVADEAAPAGARGAAAGTLANLAARATDEMKEIAHALTPYQLDKIGLAGTLEGMVRRVREACGLEIVADIEPIDDLAGPDTRIGIYRIVQEGVNNIVRHAAATEAVVRVRRHGRAIDIEIWDNGVGFSPTDLPADRGPSAGLGLTTMQERALALNGVLQVQSAPGGGTTVTVHLEPLIQQG